MGGLNNRKGPSPARVGASVTANRERLGLAGGSGWCWGCAAETGQVREVKDCVHPTYPDCSACTGFGNPIACAEDMSVGDVATATAGVPDAGAA